MVVYESTVYPGVTEEVCGPVLEVSSGLLQGEGFKLAYSPERINPGDSEHTLDRVINGTKSAGAELMLAILEQLRSGTAVPRDLELSEAAYHSFPQPDDVRAFRRRGHRML